MGYACPVCGDPQADGHHLANHLAFTAMLGEEAHAAWLADRAPGWRDADAADLAATVTEYAEETDYPQVFEAPSGHDHQHDGHDCQRTGACGASAAPDSATSGGGTGSDTVDDRVDTDTVDSGESPGTVDDRVDSGTVDAGEMHDTGDTHGETHDTGDTLAGPPDDVLAGGIDDVVAQARELTRRRRARADDPSEEGDPDKDASEESDAASDGTDDGSR